MAAWRSLSPLTEKSRSAAPLRARGWRSRLVCVPGQPAGAGGRPKRRWQLACPNRAPRQSTSRLHQSRLAEAIRLIARDSPVARERSFPFRSDSIFARVSVNPRPPFAICCPSALPNSRAVGTAMPRREVIPRFPTAGRPPQRSERARIRGASINPSMDEQLRTDSVAMISRRLATTGRVLDWRQGSAWQNFPQSSVVVGLGGRGRDAFCCEGSMRCVINLA